MKLIEIKGNIWELTILQGPPYNNIKNDDIDSDANSRLILKKDLQRGFIRCLSGNAVRCANASAIIELEVNGLPTQQRYEIYHNSKGFYCNVQGMRIFLSDLIK